MTPAQFFALTGYQFRQEHLLQQALTHRSYARKDNNERLEFLGDSILDLVISHHIFERYDSANEGDLSRIRANLVKQATVADIARGINLGEYLFLGGGELKSGGHRRASILSDAMEAVIAAVYLDSDFDSARAFVLELYRDRLSQLSTLDELKDPKTRLQEYLQARRLALPEYRVEQTRGKAHDQVFAVSCRVPDLDLSAQGSGSSRKNAEQAAARELLRRIES
ncbi:MAG: ribonuclease III [Gammaproteobacteria bacterium]|nr:ribonuclease III [Gammaproteobacteria bacterium]